MSNHNRLTQPHTLEIKDTLQKQRELVRSEGDMDHAVFFDRSFRASTNAFLEVGQGFVVLSRLVHENL
jgi:hypothetical protein